MEKLTLEQIVAYLPYGLEFITNKGKWVLESLEKGGWIVEGRKAMYVEKIFLETIKPLLLPLSELIDENFWRYYSFQNADECIEWVINGYCPYSAWIGLVEKFADVHDLISKGLALNKGDYIK